MGQKRSTYRLRSKTLLVELMDKQISIRALAERVDCSKAMIQHLREGTKTSCSESLALRIEEELGMPEGVLFSSVALPNRPSTDRPANRRQAA